MTNDLYRILENIVNIGIVDKLFISKVIKKHGKQYPVYAKGDEYEYIGIDENKCRVGYARQLDESSFTEINLGGCDKMYKQVDSYRLVIFDKNFDGNKDFFLNILKGQFSAKNITLKRVWNHSSSLLNSEQFFDTEIELMPANLYLAIDFIFEVKPKCCPQNEDICIDFKPIICK